MHCRFPGPHPGGSSADQAGGVSRPTPKGEVEGDLAGGVSRPTPKGEVEGDLAGGVSRPTPKGEVEGDLAGGVSRPTPRGRVPALGGCLVPGWWCGDPPRWLLLRAVRILLECILVVSIFSNPLL